MSKPTCSISGCSRPARARGWCQLHWARWRKSGNPGPAGPLRPFNDCCQVDECFNAPRSSTAAWCEKHYVRARRHGDPTATLIPTFDLPIATHCDRCGDEITGTPRSRRWCSELCYGRDRRNQPTQHAPCVACGGPIESSARADRVFCSARCAHRSRGARLRADQLAVLTGWVCGICQWSIDPSLRWPDQYCATVDHIIPLALGGSNDASNLQLAHARCNTVKGARTSHRTA